MKEFVKKHKILMMAILAFIVLSIVYAIKASQWKKEDAVKHLENLDGNNMPDGTLYDKTGNPTDDPNGMDWDTLVAFLAGQNSVQTQNPMYDSSMGGADNSQQGGGSSGGGGDSGGGSSQPYNPMQQSAVTPPVQPTSSVPLVLGGNVVPTPTSSVGVTGNVPFLGITPHTIGTGIAVNPLFMQSHAVTPPASGRMAQRGARRRR